MGRYNFVSPGAAAGSSIEDIMIKRRVEDRQRMLDEITRRNADMEQQRTTASIAAQEAANKRATLASVLPSVSQDEDITNHPQRAILEEFGYGTKLPTPSVETSTSFAIPDSMGDFVTQPGEMNLPGAYNADNSVPTPAPAPEPRVGFKGRDDERERNRKLARANEYKLQLQAAKTPEERAGIMFLAEAEGIDMSGPTWTALTRTPTKTFVLDEATGKVTDANIPDNARVIRRPRAPIGPAKQWFVNRKTGRGAWFSPGEDVPEDYYKGNPPATKAIVDRPLLPAGLAQRGATLRGNQGKSRQDRALYDAWQDTAVGQAMVADESVRMAVQNVLHNINPMTGEALSDPNDANDFGMSAEELRDLMSQDPDAKAVEVSQFYRLLKDIRGY